MAVLGEPSARFAGGDENVDMQELMQMRNGGSQDYEELFRYAQRVTRELARYQRAHTPPPPHPDDDAPMPPWYMNMQMMPPLLYAYEERIAELTGVIDRSVGLAEQARNLTKENDALRAELEERTDQLRQLREAGAALGDDDPDGVGIGLGLAMTPGGLSAEQAEEIQELYRLSVEQVEALGQQNQLLKLQLERMQQSVSACQQQAQQSNAQAAGAAEAFAAEQRRANSVEEARTIVERGLNEATAQLAEEASERDQLQAQLDRTRNELQLQDKNLQTLRQAYEDRCQLAAEEEERLRADLDYTAGQEKEQRQQALQFEQDLLDANEKYMIAKREGDITKQEAEQMLKLMESMERKLKDLTEQHDMAQSRMVEQDAQIADLLLERDALAAEESFTKKQAERLETRLNEEVVALQQQLDRSSESIRVSHRRQVSDLEGALERADQQTAEARARTEVLERQHRSDAAASERQQALHESEKEQLRQELEDLQQAVRRAERRSDAAQKELTSLRAEMEQTSKDAVQRTSLATAELDSGKRQCDELQRRLDRARSDLTACQKNLAETETERSLLRAEIRDERAGLTDTIEAERKQREMERETLKRQVQTAQGRVLQEEQRAAGAVREKEILRTRIQDEFVIEKQAMEAHLEQARKELRAMKDKNRVLLRKFAVQQMSAAAFDDDE